MKPIRDLIVLLCIALSGALAVIHGGSASPSRSMSQAAEGCTGAACVTQRTMGDALSDMYMECTASIPFRCRIRL